MMMPKKPTNLIEKARETQTLFKKSLRNSAQKNALTMDINKNNQNRRVLSEIEPFNSGHGSNVTRRKVRIGQFSVENKENWNGSLKLVSNKLRVSKENSARKSQKKDSKRDLMVSKALQKSQTNEIPRLMQQRSASISSVSSLSSSQGSNEQNISRPISIEFSAANSAADSESDLKISKTLRMPKKKRLSDFIQDVVMVDPRGDNASLSLKLIPRHFAELQPFSPQNPQSDFCTAYKLIEKLEKSYQQTVYTDSSAATTHKITASEKVSPTVFSVSLENLNGAIERCFLLKFNFNEDIESSLKSGTALYVPQNQQNQGIYKHDWKIVS